LEGSESRIAALEIQRLNRVGERGAIYGFEEVDHCGVLEDFIYRF
jgi:hypothetical protein